MKNPVSSVVSRKLRAFHRADVGRRLFYVMARRKRKRTAA